MLEKSNQVPNWLALCTAIQVQFGPSPFDNPKADLFKLTQTSTVVDYYGSFTKLANQSYGLYDTMLLDYFLGDLLPHLEKEVIPRAPYSLLQAMSLAKLFEEKVTPPFPSYRDCTPYFLAKPINQILPQPINEIPL